MNTSIVAKNIDLSDSIKEYIESSFDSFKKFNLDIISARCVISIEDKNSKKGFVVDFCLNLAKKETIVIKQKDKDLYTAIDLITQRISRALRKYHDKISDHSANKDEILSDLSNNRIDEVEIAELQTYKPLRIEEALEILKEGSDKFLVFYDLDVKLRVLYKKDNNKFGLF